MNPVMKKIVYFALTACLAALASCGTKDKENKDKKASGELTVQVAEPVAESVMLFKDFPGFLSAGSAIDVPARASGLITGCYYSSGDYVHKGQVLFTIESTTYEQQVVQARAALSSARSNAEYAEKRLAAMKKAFASEAVSEMDVVQAENNLTSARNSIATAQAQLKQAEVSFGYCTVRAPISGIASGGTIDVGEFVGGDGGAVMLCTIYDTSTMTANFSLEENQYRTLVGESGGLDNAIYRDVPLVFDTPMEHTYTTDLYYASPHVQQSTGTVKLEGHVKNPLNELKDGMYVSIRLPYGDRHDALLVKDASISTDQRGKYLYVVDKDDKVEYRPITVGELYQDSLRIVESGLKPGERYVTTALMSVRPGMKVKPVQ